MKLADQLLEQAAHLASVDLRRPRQASLRRAQSTAYYALFHELTDAGARMIIRRSGGDGREMVRRSYAHGRMADVCRDMLRGSSWLSQAVGGNATLQDIARSFVVLQERRHIADYDTTARLRRPRTLETVELAQAALRAWRSVRATPEAEVFLVALLLGRQRRGQAGRD